MAEAAFRCGYPTMVPYTPSSGAVTAGDMILLGNSAGVSLGVAHSDIANSTLGEISVGGGCYDCQVASNYAAWTKVYKPSANAILTTTSTNNAQFGFTVEAAAAANATVLVLHHPLI